MYHLFHGSRREKKYGLAFGFRETAFLFQLFKIGFSFGSVMLAFVGRSAAPFDLDADKVVYLTDIGLPPAVIAAMLTRDSQPVPPTLAAQATEVPANTAPPVGPGLAPGAPETAAPPAPAAEAPVALASAPPQTVIVQPQPQVVYAAPPAQPVTQQYFYSSLSPYGSWYEVPDYGWCWQPTVAVVDRSWRPYFHRGRWHYSDAGWYWHSDYSWGWAPFHYGRWHCPEGRGWVWVPDTTWGPSWVTWRRTPEYCGWAPLPPAARYHHGAGFTYHDSRVTVSFGFGLGYDAFCFIPTSRFCDRELPRHHVPRNRVRDVYNNSTVINNYYVGNNNTVINEGIGRDTVAKATRAEVRKVAIRDMPDVAASPGARTIKAERLENNGGSGVIYRPKPPVEAAQVADSYRGRQEGLRRAPGNTLSAPESGTSTITPSTFPRDRFNPQAVNTTRGATPSVRPQAPPAATAVAAPAARVELARPSPDASGNRVYSARSGANPTTILPRQEPPPNLSRPQPIARPPAQGRPDFSVPARQEPSAIPSARPSSAPRIAQPAPSVGSPGFTPRSIPALPRAEVAPTPRAIEPRLNTERRPVEIPRPASNPTPVAPVQRSMEPPRRNFAPSVQPPQYTAPAAPRQEIARPAAPSVERPAFQPRVIQPVERQVIAQPAPRFEPRQAAPPISQSAPAPRFEPRPAAAPAFIPAPAQSVAPQRQQPGPAPAAQPPAAAAARPSQPAPREVPGLRRRSTEP